MVAILFKTTSDASLFENFYTKSIAMGNALIMNKNCLKGQDSWKFFLPYRNNQLIWLFKQYVEEIRSSFNSIQD